MAETFSDNSSDSVDISGSNSAAVGLKPQSGWCLCLAWIIILHAWMIIGMNRQYEKKLPAHFRLLITNLNFNFSLQAYNDWT